MAPAPWFNIYLKTIVSMQPSLGNGLISISLDLCGQISSVEIDLATFNFEQDCEQTLIKPIKSNN